MNGDVVVLVKGVNKPSCALVDAAKGGEGGDVQIQEGLGGQLGGEQVERACREGSTSRGRRIER